MSRHRLLQMARQNAPLFLILALAFGLRLFHNSTQGFTIDESSSLLYSGSPDWRALFWDNHPILYHVLLKVWLWVWPMTEGSTRTLSAIVSVAGVYAMYKIGEVNGTKARGQAMALAMAFSVISIHHAQETRMYALFECLSAWHFWTALVLLEVDNRRNRVLYVLSLLLLISTHLLGFIPAVLTLCLVARQHPRLRNTLIAIALLTFVIVVALCIHMRWYALQWQWRLKQMLGNQAEMWDLILAYAQQSVIVVAAMLTAFVAAYWSRDRWTRFISRRLLNALILSWIAFEIGLWLSPRNLYIPRYFIFLNPYLIFIFVLGLESIQERVQLRKPPYARLASSGLLIIFVGFFSSVYEYVTPAWNKAAQLIIGEHGKVVWTTRTIGISMPYYYKAGIPVGQFNYDESTIENLKIAVEHQDVWILDGFVGRYGYFEALNRDLIRAKMKLSAYEFDNGYAEPIFVLKLWQDSEAKNRTLTDMIPPKKKQKTHDETDQ